MREALSSDQAALYKIIWRRFIASQMKPAIYSVTTVDVPAAGKSGQTNLFRCVGRTLLDPGFLAAYELDEDDQENESKLPNLQPGQALRFVKFLPEKHMTEPPKRYSQAGLIRELEKRGLGRPSTYASIVEVLLEKESMWKVTTERARLSSRTEVGRQVLEFLLIGFADIFDYGFTARWKSMRSPVDRSNGRKSWMNSGRN